MTNLKREYRHSRDKYSPEGEEGGGRYTIKAQFCDDDKLLRSETLHTNINTHKHLQIKNS